MFSWREWLWIHAVTLVLIVLVVLLGSGCGTCVGNPDGCGIPAGNNFTGDGGASGDAAGPLSLDFDSIVSAYGASSFADCGAYDETSTSSDVSKGRSCMIDALNTCSEAKYLLNSHLSGGKRFVSFVSVEKTSDPLIPCQTRVHTVSDDPARYTGDQTATCTSLNSAELFELSCGITIQ